LSPNKATSIIAFPSAGLTIPPPTPRTQDVSSLDFPAREPPRLEPTDVMGEKEYSVKVIINEKGRVRHSYSTWLHGKGTPIPRTDGKAARVN
jgi:hypothetical protein